jgi:hypothetical protein
MIPERRATITLTKDADAVAAKLHERLLFDSKMDVARIGFAYAIAHGLSPSVGDEPLGASGGSTYNVGSLDRGDEWTNLVKAFWPISDEDPALVIQTLINKGLLAMAEKSAGVYSISELLALASSGAASDEG